MGDTIGDIPKRIGNLDFNDMLTTPDLLRTLSRSGRRGSENDGGGGGGGKKKRLPSPMPDVPPGIMSYTPGSLNAGRAAREIRRMRRGQGGGYNG